MSETINNKYIIDGNTLKSIANSIRSKTGNTTQTISVSDFAKKIQLISGSDVTQGLIDGTITEIEIPYGTTYITDYCFHSRHNLARVTIPSTVTDIGFSAFSQCKKLKSIEIPDGITIIRENTFGGCEALTQIKIPDTVTNILKGAFSYCRVLPSISFPGSVTSIDDEAFLFCRSCSVYDFTNCTSVPTLGSNVFKNVASDFEISVPYSLEDEWKTATNWTEYADHINATSKEFYIKYVRYDVPSSVFTKYTKPKMTWREWVATTTSTGSEFQVWTRDGIEYICPKPIQNSTGTEQYDGVKKNGEYVSPDQEIMPGETYEIWVTKIGA